MKDLILGTVDDLVAYFLYYDRKNDEELKVGDIDVAVDNGIISIDEIVDQFRKCLVRGLK